MSKFSLFSTLRAVSRGRVATLMLAMAGVCGVSAPSFAREVSEREAQVAQTAATLEKDSGAGEKRGLQAVPKDGVKRALLIGVDDYAEFADLKYAVADVEAIRAKLLELGFKPENIVELKSTSPANLRPSQRYIRRQVDALLKAAGPNDLLFLHFSGHGFQSDDVVRFAPEDAVATGDERVVDDETTISLTEIMERLKTSKAKFKWMIIDACRENPTGTRSAAANARALKNIDPRKGVLVLQSCAEGELSFEDPDAGRGLFTGRLLEAFGGKADFDGDGQMSALDVCKYVSEQTLAASKTRFNATQTPYFSGEFADFIVAEDLKKHGLAREDWKQAETLYNKAIEAVREKDFDAALKNIDAALEIVVEVPETEDVKKRFLERKTLIDYLVGDNRKVVKLDPPSEITNDEFGKPNKFVSSVEQLEYAVENVQDGDIIQLAKGDYVLTDKLLVPNGIKLSLVGATGQKGDVRISQPQEKAGGLKETVLAVQEGTQIALADLTLDSKNKYALTTNNNEENDRACEVTIVRCSLFAADEALACWNGHALLKNSDFTGICCIREATVDAEYCNFSGGLANFPGEIDVKSTSTFKKCKFYDCKYETALSLHGDERNELFHCEIIDSEIFNAQKGVYLSDGAQATIRNVVIHDCASSYFYPAIDVSSYDTQATRANISDVAIENCELGISIDEGSVCIATNVKINRCGLGVDLDGKKNRLATFTGNNITFVDVKMEWEIETEGVNVTNNGRAVTQTPSSNWKRMVSSWPTTPTKYVKTAEELREALDFAKDGEVIQIAKGDYTFDEPFYIHYKEIALVGETGDMDDVRLIWESSNSLFNTDSSALVLNGITIKCNEDHGVGVDGFYSDLTLTRCRLYSTLSSALEAYWGKTTLKECEIYGRLSSDIPYRAIEFKGNNQNAGFTAENCNIIGAIVLELSDSTSTLSNCKIHGGGYGCIEITGSIAFPSVCNIVNCELSGGYVWIKESAQVTMRDVKMTNSPNGVILDSNGVCNATNLTFTNVRDKWKISKGSATHNGWRMTDAN